MERVVHIGNLAVGEGKPLAVIAGPCVIEPDDVVLRIAAALQAICASAGVPLVFKASFDKANRTSVHGFRGPGLDEGLRVLESVKRRFGLPVTTDVHHPEQAARAAEVVDLLQVPALLCRQTDLLLACAATGRPVNVKKGQFMAPWDMRHVVEKLESAGDGGVILTERGATFGYNNLVVDMRSLPEMKKHGVPVCFDATHAVQLPGAGEGYSGGQREHVPTLARAAVAAGADLVFCEIHENPDRALSDGPCTMPLIEVPKMLQTLRRIADAVRA